MPGRKDGQRNRLRQHNRAASTELRAVLRVPPRDLRNSRQAPMGLHHRPNFARHFSTSPTIRETTDSPDPLGKRAIPFGRRLAPPVNSASANRTTPIRASQAPRRASRIPRPSMRAWASEFSHSVAGSGSIKTRPATSSGNLTAYMLTSNPPNECPTEQHGLGTPAASAALEAPTTIGTPARRIRWIAPSQPARS